MYNELAPEFVVDQGLYYPSATNYGYICTGLESPGDWDDHHGVFGVDGQDIQFIGTQTESLPYVYYTPSYGYAQSPYNPYNPYIPGAVIGADGSVVGTQQYYYPSYENGASSPAYFPMVVQSGPDTYTSSMTDQFMDIAASTPNRVDASGFKRNLYSPAGTFSPNPGRGAPNHTNDFTRVSEGFKSNGGLTKLPVANGTISNGFSGPVSSQVLQGRGTQSIDNLSNGKALSNRNQLKVAVPSGNGLSTFGSSGNGRVIVDNVRPKLPFGKIANDVNGYSDTLTEQNRGPRTNKTKTQLTVKAYTNRAGNSDAQGNIIIHTDQYNKDEFPVEYANAKFFVIKSYSEDDVHKSIKYNVWSSTPNGNKKLNSAYEDAQRIAKGDTRGCPIFLYFSVNASGQFCGVAEMTGYVDFHKDMDFWQQDKWSGSFPVKWHIIKDVPNPNFRHIILENNEHKPVTNSRDTQEIKHRKGIEMLKVFKNYVSKTSLLDDFMYYESRQKLMQEEKARLLVKTYGTPVFVPVLDPPRKLNSLFDLSSSGDEKTAKHNDLVTSHNDIAVASHEQNIVDVDVCKPSVATNDPKQVANGKTAEDARKAEDGKTTEDDVLKISLLTISPRQTQPKQLEITSGAAAAATAATVAPESAGVLTVGSLPVKVNMISESAGFLTIGTIPLDPNALKVEKASVSTKTGSQKG